METSRSSNAGFTLTELLVVLVLATVMLFVSVMMLGDYFRDREVDSAVMTIQNTVWSGRFRSLKTKQPHRVKLNDENGATPNVVELQKDETGTFVTLPQQTYSLPDSVDILGTTPDSIDEVTIGRRGECEAGNVYLRGHDGGIKTVSINANCLVDVL